MSVNRSLRAAPAAPPTGPYGRCVVDPGVGRLGLLRAAGARPAARARPISWPPATRRCSCCRCPAAASVRAEGETFDAGTAGRACSAAVTDFAYVPRDATPSVAQRARRPVRAAVGAGRRGGCRPATARPRTSPSSCAAPGRPAARSTTSARPQVFDADQLIAVEVLTPAGNWSSYPPHKHDEQPPRRGAAGGDLLLRGRQPAAGIGYQRVYGTGPDRQIDVLAEVRTGDAVLDPARLARPVDGRARLRPVLPQRHGRARRAARLAASATTPRTPGSAPPGPTSRSTRGFR